MKRVMFFSLLVILVFCTSLVVHLPLSFAVKYMPEVRGLQLSGLNGTLWQGSAKTVRWNNRNFGQLNWDFQPASLFSGKAQFAVRFGRDSDLNLSGKGIVGADFSGLYAENVFASVPVSSVQSQVQIPVPVTATGQLELSVSEYRFAQPWCESATGSLVWNASEVQSPLGTLSPGTIIADISCKDSVLSASSAHDHPQLSGAFTATLDSSRQYKMDAWFKPNSEFPQAMTSQLKWLGNPDSQGRYPFLFSGGLRY